MAQRSLKNVSKVTCLSELKFIAAHLGPSFIIHTTNCLFNCFSCQTKVNVSPYLLDNTPRIDIFMVWHSSKKMRKHETQVTRLSSALSLNLCEKIRGGCVLTCKTVQQLHTAYL